jgi:hypothetical protein
MLTLPYNSLLNQSTTHQYAHSRLLEHRPLGRLASSAASPQYVRYVLDWRYPISAKRGQTRNSSFVACGAVPSHCECEHINTKITRLNCDQLTNQSFMGTHIFAFRPEILSINILNAPGLSGKFIDIFTRRPLSTNPFSIIIDTVFTSILPPVISAAVF